MKNATTVTTLTDVPATSGRRRSYALLTRCLL